jgi:hypothetical protein
MLFKKAVIFTKDKTHLLEENKYKIIKYQEEIIKMSDKWVPDYNSNIKITKYWLAGFIDGDGTFSTNKYVPRFKLENHIKELNLYYKIKEFLGTGNLVIINRQKENLHTTIVLEVNKVKNLIHIIIPLMYDNNKLILKSSKSSDFIWWKKLVDLYYKGYHTLPEGKVVYDGIKSYMNKYRLTTNLKLKKVIISVSELNNLINTLYSKDSPYVIKQDIRYYRDTNKLVSEAIAITAIDNNNNKVIYNNISECSIELKISRKKIKDCIDTGKPYKGYSFVYN